MDLIILTGTVEILHHLLFIENINFCISFEDTVDRNRELITDISNPHPWYTHSKEEFMFLPIETKCELKAPEISLSH